MNIESQSNDNFKTQTNIKVKEIHTPPMQTKETRNLNQEINKNLPPMTSNIDAIVVLEKNIPLNKSELEKMDIDIVEFLFDLPTGQRFRECIGINKRVLGLKLESVFLNNFLPGRASV